MYGVLCVGVRACVCVCVYVYVCVCVCVYMCVHVCVFGYTLGIVSLHTRPPALAVITEGEVLWLR